MKEIPLGNIPVVVKDWLSAFYIKNNKPKPHRIPLNFCLENSMGHSWLPGLDVNLVKIPLGLHQPGLLAVEKSYVCFVQLVRVGFLKTHRTAFLWKWFGLSARNIACQHPSYYPGWENQPVSLPPYPAPGPLPPYSLFVGAATETWPCLVQEAGSEPLLGGTEDEIFTFPPCVPVLTKLSRDQMIGCAVPGDYTMF